MATQSTTLPSAMLPSVGRLLLPEGRTIPPARRLLVLVPGPDAAEAEVARRACALARPANLGVLFVGRVAAAGQEAAVRRQLADLAALTRDAGISAATRLALEPNWLRAVEAAWQPSDIVVCFAGQMAATGWLGLRHEALDTVLLQRLQSPVMRLEAVPNKWTRRRPGLLERLALMAAVLACVAGFFWLQVQLEHVSAEPLRSLLLIFSVVAEFGLIAWLAAPDRLAG